MPFSAFLTGQGTSNNNGEGGRVYGIGSGGGGSADEEEMDDDAN